REVVTQKAVSKAARFAVAAGLRHYFPQFVKAMTAQQLDEHLALSSSDFLAAAFARPRTKITLPLAHGLVSNEIVKALTMSRPRFRRWSKERPPEFQSAVAE